MKLMALTYFATIASKAKLTQYWYRWRDDVFVNMKSIKRYLWCSSVIQTLTMGTETAQSITQSLHYYRLSGDLINSFVLISSVLCAFTAIYFTQPNAPIGVVDEYWKRDGFCINNADIPYWSSFDTCLYVDSICSIILAILWLRWRELPGMKSANANMLSVILATYGHGMAHGLMAYKLRDGSYHEVEAAETIQRIPIAGVLMGAAMFWYPLIKIAMQGVDNKYVALFAVLAMYVQGYLRKNLQFAYVHTVVYITYCTSQLIKSYWLKERQREYMMSALFNLIPALVAWLEIFFCDSFFRAIGGHTVYDLSIPVSFGLFYIDCYYHHNVKFRLVKSKTA